MTAPEQNPQPANRRLLWQLSIAAVAMFGFGYLLVPLYHVFCEPVGIERGAQLEAVTQAVAEAPDLNRTVTVEFLLSVNSGRWDFAIQQRRMQVHPGKFYTAIVTVTNLADVPVTGQAIFSTAPSSAGGYVRKTECFCFSPQPFAANETRELPIRFMLDPDLPGNIETVTFAYTMYQLVQPTARQLRYDHGYWGAVFPLGMYSVCTQRLGREFGLEFLMPLGVTFAWIALFAWAATAFGLTAHLLRRS